MCGTDKSLNMQHMNAQWGQISANKHIQKLLSAYLLRTPIQSLPGVFNNDSIPIMSGQSLVSNVVNVP